MIQEAARLYAEGNSGRMVASLLSLSYSTVESWINKGLIPARSHEEAMQLAAKKGRMKGAQGWTEKARNRQRMHMLRRISENPDNHPNRKLAGNRRKMSFPERLAFDTLTTAQIAFKHNQRIDRYYPDFVIGMLIIEIDGERWHDPIQDAARDARLKELGYTVHRISAKEVIKNPRIVLDRLQVL